MTEQTMRERLARALVDRYGIGLWEKLNDTARNLYFGDVDAILSALAEPTPEIVEAMCFAMCEAEGRDPHQMTYHHNGDCVEPYGEVWEHNKAAAEAAFTAAIRKAGEA